MEPFKIHILGCGSALPTLRHFSSMQVVVCRGKLFMIDCGEGAQLQIRRSGLSFERLGHIFISHIHGDHCFGLIGLISTFGLLGRTATLNVHAPAELQPMLQAQLDLFFNYDIGYKVEFHPVDTTQQQVIYEDRSLTVESIPLEHRMPCCGFLFREKPTLPHIRRDMIDMYEIPISQINNIKSGLGYTLPDGTYIEHERLVTEADKPRSYAYCSDTRYMPRLHEMISGVELKDKVSMGMRPSMHQFKLLVDVLPFKNNKHWSLTTGIFVGPAQVGDACNKDQEMPLLFVQ